MDAEVRLRSLHNVSSMIEFLTPDITHVISTFKVSSWVKCQYLHAGLSAEYNIRVLGLTLESHGNCERGTPFFVIMKGCFPGAFQGNHICQF